MPEKPYYSNHINVQKTRSLLHDERGRCEQWECSLNGEYVGTIDYTEKPKYPYQTQYTAYVCHPEDRRHSSCVGSFTNMFAARNALLDPARQTLTKEKHTAERQETPVAFLPEADCQFYPTPSDVAGRLMAGIDWRGISSVLEPSAGRGDLLEWAVRRCKKIRPSIRGFCGTYSIDLDDVDCVEIDPNLRSMLAGKGYRVVHDDFLTYHTRKCYDLILMNPPFAQGDLHLLHALDLCKNGGQIACILNAETIRNPFTNSRKVLMKLLHKYNASIRFVENGFAHAARKARVDLALINVRIPYADADTVIWDNLQKAREKEFVRNGLHEVAPADPFERLILEYDLLCQAGIAMMEAYNGVSDRIHSGKDPRSAPIITLNVAGRSTDACGPEEVNRFLRDARARYWRELFDLPELRKKMTSSMQQEYHGTIERMKDYEFSLFNIQQVVNQIMSQIVSGVEEAVVKCFDKLSAEHSYHTDVQNENVHYYNGWKTNKAHYVNAKCIIPTWGCFAKEYKADKYGRYKDVLTDLDARGCFEVLDDLEKALDYLDKGETASTDLAQALKIAAANGKTSVCCKYFMVTFYKKGTCHIKFHDQKIVDRLNIAVGRQRSWLPPAYGKVRYEQLDQESRRVVDEFQGREKYEAIMDAPSDYIIDQNPQSMLLLGVMS